MEAKKVWHSVLGPFSHHVVGLNDIYVYLYMTAQYSMCDRM